MRSPRTARARVIGATAAAALALPLVSACQTNAGTAAFVGNSRISTDDLRAFAQRSEEALAASGGAQGATPVAVQRNDLSLLITDKLLERVAADKGIVASDSDVRAFQAQQLGTNGAQLTQQLSMQGIGPADQGLLFRLQLLDTAIAAKLGAKSNQQSDPTLPLIIEQSKREGVKVNPRFGSWDASKLRVLPPANDLSGPASPSGPPSIAP